MPKSKKKSVKYLEKRTKINVQKWVLGELVFFSVYSYWSRKKDEIKF